MLYKFLRPGRVAPFSGVVYPLGEWMPPIEGPLEVCKNGYHVCRPADLPYWIEAELYEVKIRGERLESANKLVVREVRLVRRIEAWNEWTQRLFACDCAEHVAHLSDDPRVRECIAVARRYAMGEATDEALRTARAAAEAAARAAAEVAAWVAARAAAWVAARAGARAAAEAAARAAARADEREWQTQRLLEIIGWGGGDAH